MRLLEAKRAIHLTSSDFYHRLRELRERVSGKRTFMRSNANIYESRDQVESMLEHAVQRLTLGRHACHTDQEIGELCPRVDLGISQVRVVVGFLALEATCADVGRRSLLTVLVRLAMGPDSDRPGFSPCSSSTAMMLILPRKELDSCTVSFSFSFCWMQGAKAKALSVSETLVIALAAVVTLERFLDVDGNGAGWLSSRLAAGRCHRWLRGGAYGLQRLVGLT